VGVQDDRRLARQVVAEHARQAAVPAFGHPRGILRGRRRGRIEVQVEVLRLQDAEVERLVLDLVAAEILRSSLSRKEDGREDQPGERRRQRARRPRGEAAADSVVIHVPSPSWSIPTACRDDRTPDRSVRGNGRGLSCRTAWVGQVMDQRAAPCRDWPGRVCGPRLSSRSPSQGAAMILVAGATGQLGSLVTRRLLARGEVVRILVRPGSDYQPLVDERAQRVFGDLKDPASLATACEGVSVVVTTANSAARGGADTVETVDLLGNRALVDAAKAAGVGQFVFTSALGADPVSPVPFLRAKGETERHLRDSGMTYTILSPNIFMEVWVPMLVGQAALE